MKKNFVIAALVMFISIFMLSISLHADTPTPTITPTLTSTITPVPKPYMFWLKTPIGLNAIVPAGVVVDGFVSGYNDDVYKYQYIVLTATSEGEAPFIQWLYYVVENSPVEIWFEEVGNNTANAKYDFVRPLIE